jgi:DNA-directed RNA polymerase subunit RPC12/RpoP
MTTTPAVGRYQCRNQECRHEFEIRALRPNSTDTVDTACPKCGHRYDLRRPAEE